MTSAPDYVEPVIGWRVWRLVHASGALYLASLFHYVRWPWREPLSASCMAPRAPWRWWTQRHPAPVDRCQCGIYAMPLSALRSPGLPSDALSSQVVVVGRVSLWGRVVECDQGWRAELAYPEQLFVGRGVRGRDGVHVDTADALESCYGVPAVARATVGVGALIKDVRVLTLA